MDLTLERIVLLLGDLALLELLIGLLRSQLQRFQLFLRLGNGILQELLLLGHQFRIGRVQLQQLLHVLQLCLGILDLLVDPGQRGRQFCGIAADLYRDSLDSGCHALTTSLLA